MTHEEKGNIDKYQINGSYTAKNMTLMHLHSQTKEYISFVIEKRKWSKIIWYDL